MDVFATAAVLAIFADICKIQQLVPMLGAAQFQKILLGVSVLGLLLRPNLRDAVGRSARTSLGHILIFLSVWMVLSVPLSAYPGWSFRFLTEVYWKSLVTVAVVVGYGSSVKGLERMTSAVIWAVSIYATAALASGDSGRFSFVEAYDPNENALLFVWSFPLVFWRMVGTRGLRKLLLGLLLAMLVAAVVATQSRGGFLGLVAVVVVSLIHFNRVRRIGLAGFLAATALVTVVIYARGGSQYLERLASITDTEQNYNYTAEEGRLNVWREGVSMMTRNPVLGVGVNAFFAANGSVRGLTRQWQVAHNAYIQVGAELGVSGLMAYCLLLFGSARAVQGIGRAALVRDSELQAVAYRAFGLACAWIGFASCAFFLSVAYINIFFVTLGLSWAFINGESAGQPGDERVTQISSAQGARTHA